MNRKLFIGFVSLFAGTALAALPGMAQAETAELGRCVKLAGEKTTGDYTKSNCIEVSKSHEGQYEWQPGTIKAHFTSTAGESVLGTVGGSTMTCKSATDKGEYIGSSEDRETIVFKNCTSGGKACTSSGRAEGEVETSLLISRLGVIEPGKAGVSLEALEKLDFLQAKCGVAEIKVTGSVIASIGSGEMLTVFKEKFEASKGIQKPEKFEGASKDVLEASFEGKSFEQTGLTSSDEVTNEEALEIRVVKTPRWWVEKSLLVGSEAIAETTSVPAPFRLTLLVEKVSEVGTVECPEVHVKSGKIEAPSSRSEKAVEFLGCKVLEPHSATENPNCKVVGGKIVTNELKANLIGPAGAEKLKFEEKAGKRELGKFEIENGVGSCSFKGKFKANGVMVCNYNEVENESEEHPLEFTKQSGSNVTLEGPAETNPQEGLTLTDKVHLVSKKSWSAF
ncbi:MAG TPA: hypothetical protein VHT29_05510 [Solirubrobacteraceae bacterium]|jgi:hypothetical protein|nr:hypothetical protein [Solirubrobacteraceae bacterium]